MLRLYFIVFTDSCGIYCIFDCVPKLVHGFSFVLPFVDPITIISLLYYQISKREQFFKNEAPATKFEAPSTKFDPSNRERDGKAEKLGAPKENGHSCLPGSRNDSAKNLEGYVGFANLPNQVYRKSVKRGFEFTLMVVGKVNYL